MHNEPANTLCRACGLCCRGGWFANVELAANEDKPARETGFSVRFEEGRHLADLPCVAFVDGACSIYDAWRPSACEIYSCALRDALVEGRVDLPAALEHVRQAVYYFEAIQQAEGTLPEGLQLGCFRTAVESGYYENFSPASLANLVALAVSFEKYFYKEPRQQEDGAQP